MAKRSLITMSCYKRLAGSVKSNQVKNRLDDFMLKKAGRAEERERTKLGLCRFRPIINNTLGAEAVFREIRSLSTKALNSMLDYFSAGIKLFFPAIYKDSLFISFIAAAIGAKSK